MRQYLFNDLAREGPVGRDTRDETCGFKPIEPPQCQGRQVRFLRPRRPELGTARDQHENREVRDTLDRERQQFERTRVDPVYILVKNEHGLPRG